MPRECSFSAHGLFFTCSLYSFSFVQSSNVLQLLVRYGLDPLAEVSDTGQSLLEFAQEAAARADSIALLRTALEKRKGKQPGDAQATSGGNNSNSSAASSTLDAVMSLGTEGKETSAAAPKL